MATSGIVFSEGFMTQQSIIEAFRAQVDIAITTTGYTVAAGNLDTTDDTEVFYVIGKRLLSDIIQQLTAQFPSIRFGLIHGSTPQGFDLVTQQVAQQYGLPQLGVSCPEWAKYLPSDLAFPVVWANSKKEFPSVLTELGDFILQFGGRMNSIKATVSAVANQKKFAIVISPHEALFGKGTLANVSNGSDLASSVIARTLMIEGNGCNQFVSLVEETISSLLPHLRSILPASCLSAQPSASNGTRLSDIHLPSLPEGAPDGLMFPTPALFKRGNESVLWLWTEREPKSGVVRYDEAANAWLVEKTFTKLRLVLERDAASLSAHLAKPDVLVLGPTGFSSLKPADLELLGLAEGDYEAAVEAYMFHLAHLVHQAYPDVELVLADGASDAGVDKAAIAVSKRLATDNVARIGHTCFKYLQYVKDEEGVVIVSDTPEAYAQVFTRHVDVLLALGGRDHALELDIASVTSSLRKLLVIPQLIKTVSRDGSAPPVRTGDKLVDATGLFGAHLRIVSSTAIDPLNDTVQRAADEACDVCRRLVAAKHKFEQVRFSISVAR
jgi:hypothetical protein